MVEARVEEGTLFVLPSASHLRAEWSLMDWGGGDGGAGNRLWNAGS